MKKYIKILSVLLFVFILTGCKSDKKIETVLYNELKDQGIIEDLTYITKMTYYNYDEDGFPDETYIYKNKWGELYGIHYEEYYGEKDYDYVILISYDGIELEDPFYISEETVANYIYDDETITLKAKYQFGRSTYYTVKKKDKFFGLLGTDYEIKKVED